jgi:hypothetical protein
MLNFATPDVLSHVDVAVLLLSILRIFKFIFLVRRPTSIWGPKTISITIIEKLPGHLGQMHLNRGLVPEKQLRGQVAVAGPVGLSPCVSCVSEFNCILQRRVLKAKQFTELFD